MVRRRSEIASTTMRIACLAGLLIVVGAFLLRIATRDDGPGPIIANPMLPASTWVVGSPPLQSVITLETAVTPEQQRRGLMARDSIGTTDGMVFLRDGDDASFWMRGTRIPLDIVYIAPDGRVSKVVRGTPNDETTLPGGPASLVIEVAAGRARLLGLVPGATVVRSDGQPIPPSPSPSPSG